MALAGNLQWRQRRNGWRGGFESASIMKASACRLAAGGGNQWLIGIMASAAAYGGMA